MLTVHQHWDPLKVCLVGRSYPPEFYSFIENPRVRDVLERIAIETEEDYQKLINLLEKFNVKVIRTDISDNFDDYFDGKRYLQPPMCPRDHTAMIGDTFYMPGENFSDVNQIIEEQYGKDQIMVALSHHRSSDDKENYERLLFHLMEDFYTIRTCITSMYPCNKKFNSFSTIEGYLKENNTKIVYDEYIDTAMVTRVGKDLYFGTVHPKQNLVKMREKVDRLFPEYRNHLVDTKTHSDGVYCPVVPGLIISLNGVQEYSETFPGWEVVYLPNQSWDKVQPFLDLKVKNGGKWWVPGEELNDDFTEFVESWLKDWVLYVEETVFDVNMLVIDEKNVICNGYNKEVFDAFERFGITPHIINFRHRYFWDGGIHCITSDIAREGELKDYFPERN